MAIPDYQTLMLPVLKLSQNSEVKISDVVEKLSSDFNLTDQERAETLPSGRQTVIGNRTHWAKSYLKQAGLVSATRRGYFIISGAGKKALAENPKKIDIPFLMQFPEFVDFRSRTGNASVKEPAIVSHTASIELIETPEEVMRDKHAELNATLAAEMLSIVQSSTPAFFERLIVQLLLAMGFGSTAIDAGRAIGRAGDDGVDGVVDQDVLGLDRVYIQAKKYKADLSVGPAAIREFSGSLELHKASKGIFVTTSTFTKSATETAERLGKRIVLIDGNYLGQLMIRYNVGCRVEERLEIKRLDEEFFD
jgi:restriction system protein